MKIGIDCRIYSSKFTGIGRYTHELVDHFIRLNNELPQPHQIVLFFNNPEYRDFTTSNPHVKKVLADAKHYSLSEQIHFLKVLNKESCDLVHFPHFNLPIFYRKPFIVTIHDLTLSIFPGRKMTKLHHRLAYQLTIRHAVKKSRKIIAVSQNTKNDITKFLKTPSKKIDVIYNGISKEFKIIPQPNFKKTLEKYHITQPFLLYTGVWRSHKNLPRLIQAFAQLKHNQKLPLQLVITGKPDPHYPEVKNTVKAFNLQQDVIFTGMVDEKELVELYNAAAIYVFPSLYEGFGFPPLEAMQCGTPVVSSNTSSLPEICGQENALFFDPTNPDDIAEKIATLYKDTGLQAELIAKGAHRAAEFSWEKTARETFEIICSHANIT